jgi:hypothetical protein
MTHGCLDIVRAAAPLLFSARGVHLGAAGHDVEKLLVSSLADHEGISLAWFAGLELVELGLGWGSIRGWF